MPQQHIKNSLERIKYLIKCLTYILSISLIILEINNYKFIKYNVKEIYSPVYAPGKILKDYYPISPMNDYMWGYLKTGLNYLETDGKNYPPAFTHPGGKAFGPLGLTQAAIEDVITRCRGLSQFNPAEVLSDSKIYEDFAKAYVDILLRHYLKVNYWALPAEEVFDILQKAWFLGPGLYKNGGQVISSRQQRANEYKFRVNTKNNPAILTNLNINLTL